MRRNDSGTGAHMTYAERQEYQEKWIQWASGMDCSLFVTLCFNREATHERMRAKFRAVLAHIDRAFLGRNWCKRDAEQRTFALATIENPTSNAHLHCLMRPSARMAVLPVGEQERFLASVWKRLVPGGTCVAKLIETQDRLAGYIAKQLPRPGHLEAYFVSSEFHR